MKSDLQVNFSLLFIILLYFFELSNSSHTCVHTYIYIYVTEIYQYEYTKAHACVWMPKGRAASVDDPKHWTQKIRKAVNMYM